MKNRDRAIIIGKRIEERRIALCYAQDAFARMVGLSKTYYAGLEKGMVNPGEACLERVANALGIPMSDLLKGI